ncbi:hypothetical protein PT974_03392 [Cladobotryum mycophilum]|uniref:Uncharacterized protein n=1 Tax=Cladobotryum mycophilum TaxID=491253 RepID=A0ABR0SS59_9HYPO
MSELLGLAQSPRTVFEVLYSADTTCSSRQGQRDIHLNETQDDVDVALQILCQITRSAGDQMGEPWSNIDYEAVWNSSSGGATWLQAPARFFIQTPQDDTGLCCSFGASAIVGDDNKRSFRSLLIMSQSQLSILEHCKWEIPREWESSDLPLAILPLTLLQAHVNQTSQTLTLLIQRIERIEAQVLNSLTIVDFASLIRDLHACNSDLIKLQRRRHFETELIVVLREFIGKHKTATTNYQHIQVNIAQSIFKGNTTINTQNSSQELAESSIDGQSRPFKLLDSFFVLQERRSQVSKYDLEVLPRRIKNQFTAVYNLIAQRDTKANIELADKSRVIAEATLRDSSSMKTIAVMTLVFLPATFVCASRQPPPHIRRPTNFVPNTIWSFFSISFFNWQADTKVMASRRIWIYFAVASPLTLVVLLCWVLRTRKSREKRS